MQFLFLFLFIIGFYPLLRAWQANCRTSLAHAVFWATAAWVGWGLALAVGRPGQMGFDPWRYLALCLTSAAGVAVLGARKPQVGAWNFVILGLLAVMLLPLGEHLFLGLPSLEGLRIFFLGATLAVGIINYVPTGAWFPAFFLGCICVIEFMVLFTGRLVLGPWALDILHICLLLIPWIGLAAWRNPPTPGLAINKLWRGFRDSFGLLWGQRVRDQYNRGAAHVGLPGYLFWHGWENSSNAAPPTVEQTREMHAILQALLQRFAETGVHEPDVQAS